MIIVMLFSRFRPSPPKCRCLASQKKGVFPRRFTPKIESVEEPTEAPEEIQDSDQEDSSQEDSSQDDPVQETSTQEDSDLEDPAQEDSAQEDSDQEDSAQEDSEQEDTAQQPADAEDSLEAEVDFLMHCLLSLPPKSHARANLPFCCASVLCPESGSWTWGVWGGTNREFLLREAHSDPRDLR